MQRYLEEAGWQRAGAYILATICQHRKNLTYTVPSTVPDTDSSSAVRFNTCVPGANLPAKVKMKEDTVQVQTEYSTYCGNTGLFPERTKEIADQERSFQNKPECKRQ